MTAHEIELQLIREGLAPYPMDTFSMTESEAQRVGADGEYSLADYMESDNCPLSVAITLEMLERLSEEELEALVGEDDTIAEEETPPAMFDWLKK